MTLEIYNELHKVAREHDNFGNKWIEFFYKNYPLDVGEKINGGVCLDAGCGGTVKGVRLINKFNPVKIFACDINKNHQGLYLNEERTRFINCDIAQLPFKENNFDFILCNGVAHHTPDPNKTVRELLRVLKPDGVMHISVYCFKASLFRVFVLLLRCLSKIIPFKLSKKLCGNNFLLSVLLDHAYVPHEHIYTKKAFAAMLNSMGATINCILDIAESYKCDKNYGSLVKNKKLLFGDGAILSFIVSKSKIVDKQVTY